MPGLKLGGLTGVANMPSGNDQNYVSRTARGPIDRIKPVGTKDMPMLSLGEDSSEDIIQRQITVLKHKQLQLKFMGDENKNLNEQVAHLQ